MKQNIEYKWNNILTGLIPEDKFCGELDFVIWDQFNKTSGFCWQTGSLPSFIKNDLE